MSSTSNDSIIASIRLYIRNTSEYCDYDDDDDDVYEDGYYGRKNIIVSDRAINLSYEGLTYVPIEFIENFAKTTRSFDISHNDVSSLHFLEGFDNLNSLVLDNNTTLNPTTLPVLNKVTLLWLNNCNIDLLSLHAWIFQIQKCCPRIKYLSMISNPGTASLLMDRTCEDYVNYRNFIIKSLPSLIYLDASPTKPRVYRKAPPARSYLQLNKIISDIAAFFQRITSRKTDTKYLFRNTSRTKIFGNLIENSIMYDDSFTKNK